MSSATPLLAAFDFQVNWCRDPAPFTSRVLHRSRVWLAADAAAHEVLAAIATDPLAAAMALRWAGALHHLALRGLSPWRELWPPAGRILAADGDEPTLDAALDDALRLAWAQHRDHCLAALALPPQTNEVMRSAVLLPGLLHIAAHTGLPLALLEIGASAGLNLWCDRYGHQHGSWAWGSANATLTLRSEWRGEIPGQAGTDLQVQRRAACDAYPIDLDLPDEGLRLASFIWPEQSERLARLRAACRESRACFRASGLAVEKSAAIDFVQRELTSPAPGLATVLMHSVMWQYMDGAEQAAITAAMDAAGARASSDSPLAWLRMEPPTPDSRVELRCRLWPDGADRLLARVHPHGATIEWLGRAQAGPS